MVKVRKLTSGVLFAAFALAFVSGASIVVAQTSPPQPDAQQQEMQQKVPQGVRKMQQATVRNEQQLHTYQWLESTTLTFDGKSMPAKQSICRYAEDGTVLKTPLGQEMSGPTGGGPLKKHIVKVKKEKIEGEVGQIHALMQLYLPLDQAKLKDVLQTGKVDFEHDGTNGDAAVILNNYVKQGDQVKLTLNPTTRQVDRISIKTYLDQPEDVMTTDVHFAILPDRTVYQAVTSIEAPSDKLSITTANLEYSKVVY